MSASDFKVDWPLPEDDITGLITQDRPISRTASRYSSRVSTKR